MAFSSIRTNFDAGATRTSMGADSGVPYLRAKFLKSGTPWPEDYLLNCRLPFRGEMDGPEFPKRCRSAICREKRMTGLVINTWPAS